MQTRNWWPLAAVAVGIILLMCCCVAATAGFFILRASSSSVRLTGPLPVVQLPALPLPGSQVEAAAEEQLVLEAPSPAVLSISVPVGDVTVQAGSGSQVQVTATRRAWGASAAAAQAALDRISVRLERTDNGARVITAGLNADQNPLRSPRVDLVVAAPAGTNLELQVAVGATAINGIRGDVAVDAKLGQVTLRDVQPRQTLTVTSQVASIEMHGPLAAGASYDLASDVGRVILFLPRESAFSISAVSDVGNVSLGFPLAGRDANQGFVGRSVTGDVGSNPTTRLRLRSRVGEISVQPQP